MINTTKLLSIAGALALTLSAPMAQIAFAHDDRPGSSQDAPEIDNTDAPGHNRQGGHVRMHFATNAVRAARTNNLTYHGGNVMTSVMVYTIYWQPAGSVFAAGYQTLLNRYYTDVNASAFYNINVQYYQGSTTKLFMTNSSTFAGTWTDTTAYTGGRGSAANPLTDADIQGAVSRAITANGWVADGTAQFVVFTGKGIESCYDAVDCTPGTSHPVYCAYHSDFISGGRDIIYSNMPYGATWGSSCRSFSVSPNGNLDADTEISTASHEHFESATDPFGTAWYDRLGNENGDKCAYNYGTISANGSNITMGGNPYIIQQEWSNSAGGCRKS